MNIFNSLSDRHVVRLGDLQDLESRAAIHASQLSRLRGDGALQREVARLEMVVEALTRAIVRGGVVTADGLARILHEVDVEDGVVDGRKTKKPKPPARRLVR